MAWTLKPCFCDRGWGKGAIMKTDEDGAGVGSPGELPELIFLEGCYTGYIQISRAN